MPNAGAGTAVEAGARCRRLIAAGATRLSVGFDLPTRLGHDSDSLPARGEVGRSGVAIDSIDDMRVLFGGVPLDRISTSMRIDGPAPVLLLLYELVAEEQGTRARRLSGTLHSAATARLRENRPSALPDWSAERLRDDVLMYCRDRLPGWSVVPARDTGVPAATSAVASAAVSAAGPARDPARDRTVEREQGERLAKLRAWRDQDRLGGHLESLRHAADGDGNLLHPMKDALSAGATVGEICGVLRAVRPHHGAGRRGGTVTLSETL